MVLHTASPLTHVLKLQPCSCTLLTQSVMGVNLDTLRPEPTVEGYTTLGGYSYKVSVRWQKLPVHALQAWKSHLGSQCDLCNQSCWQRVPTWPFWVDLSQATFPRLPDPTLPNILMQSCPMVIEAQLCNGISGNIGIICVLGHSKRGESSGIAGTIAKENGLIGGLAGELLGAFF
eukprot:1140941-Pelagomonas_calceolata.AAC.6